MKADTSSTGVKEDYIEGLKVYAVKYFIAIVLLLAKRYYKKQGIPGQCVYWNSFDFMMF